MASSCLYRATTRLIPTLPKPQLPRPLSKRSIHSTPIPLIRLRPSTRHRKKDPKAVDADGNPLPEDVYSKKMDMPTINFYEQPEDRSTEPTLVDRITTWDQLRQKRKSEAAQEKQNEVLMKEFEQKWAGKSEELPDNVDVPLHKRILTAERDPVHKAAMAALRIRLEAPHKDDVNVAKLNSSLKLAYVGANVLVQKDLWKAYLMTRGLPGLLAAIPEPSWDIIYYSQATLPEGHPGKKDIMAKLEADLKSVGRDGPPTPGLLETGEEEALEEEEEQDISEDEMMEQLKQQFSAVGAQNVDENADPASMLEGEEEEDEDEEEGEEYNPTLEELQEKLKDYEDVSIEEMLENLTDEQLQAFLEDPRLEASLSDEDFKELQEAIYGKDSSAQDLEELEEAEEAEQAFIRNNNITIDVKKNE